MQGPKWLLNKVARCLAAQQMMLSHNGKYNETFCFYSQLYAAHVHRIACSGNMSVSLSICGWCIHCIQLVELNVAEAMLQPSLGVLICLFSLLSVMCDQMSVIFQRLQRRT